MSLIIHGPNPTQNEVLWSLWVNNFIQPELTQFVLTLVQIRPQKRGPLEKDNFFCFFK